MSQSLLIDLQNGSTQMAVVGLGYVGLPMAVAFSQKMNVIGFDVNEKKIAMYQSGIDPTHEVGDQAIKQSAVLFTADENDLKKAQFFIVTVPTPVGLDKIPDLSPVIEASTIIGRYLTEGSAVVYESTVYPGVTEELCIPILEKESGLKLGKDFKVGYSPERINPGDREHYFSNIQKIVSGSDDEATDMFAKIYEMVVEAGVYRASSIKVAEAAKVVENSQRDINIAFMNELAMVFNRMNIDTGEVLMAMNTKWNALGFSPGLVGGHCIGVDPYYFIYKAEMLGYHSQIILAGRKVNDGMGAYVADAAIRQMILSGKLVRDSKVVVLGLTFKENCPDIRNSKVKDIIDRLNEYGIKAQVTDPQADAAEAKMVYGLDLTPLEHVCDADCVIAAVAHHEFRALPWPQLDSMYKSNQEKVLLDVKGIYDKQQASIRGYRYWSL